MNDMEEYDKKVFGTEPKKPMTLEDMDRAFSLGWKELFRQKKEILSLIESKEEENNELLKIIIEKLEKLEG